MLASAKVLASLYEYSSHCFDIEPVVKADLISDRNSRRSYDMGNYFDS
jgi:hypothetical protein